MPPRTPASTRTAARPSAVPGQFRSRAAAPALRTASRIASAATIASSAYPSTGDEVRHEVDRAEQVGGEQRQHHPGPPRDPPVAHQPHHEPHHVRPESHGVPRTQIDAESARLDGEHDDERAPDEQQTADDGGHDLQPLQHRASSRTLSKNERRLSA
jgi:hypothetical protein